MPPTDPSLAAINSPWRCCRPSGSRKQEPSGHIEWKSLSESNNTDSQFIKILVCVEELRFGPIGGLSLVWRRPLGAFTSPARKA